MGARTWIGILLGLAMLAALAVWAFSGRDYVFRFSEDDLRQQLDSRLPYERTYLAIFDVTLDKPRIDLVEGSDRIAGGVDVQLKARLGQAELVFNGAADMSGGLRYDGDARAFFIDDPQIENLRLPGVPDSIANKANDAISSTLREFYRTRPLYVVE
ncbi:MAG: DUF1439 domain-containing protein [Parvularculaceae bacterium]